MAEEIEEYAGSLPYPEPLRSLETKGIRIRKNIDGSVYIAFTQSAYLRFKQALIKSNKDYVMPRVMELDPNAFEVSLLLALRRVEFGFEKLEDIKFGDIELSV